ncbi:MAG: DUF3592 domain-containing protein [bacterium]|nr:DUF3592 domain-containing protein [bacterium]
MLNELWMREEIQLLALLMSPFVFIAVVMLLFWLIGRLRFAGQRGAWRQTTGRVLRADVMDDGDNGYYPQVVYEYMVDGKRYEADRMAPGLTLTQGSRARIEQQIQAYPPGKTVTVYYNPRRPSQAVLEMSARSNQGCLWGALLILLIVGIFSAVWILLADPNSFLQPLVKGG